MVEYNETLILLIQSWLANRNKPNLNIVYLIKSKLFKLLMYIFGANLATLGTCSSLISINKQLQFAILYKTSKVRFC